MKKLFEKKVFSIIIIGILMILETMLCVANWCGGDFNGGTLVLFILMMGMLVLCGIGLWKSNKLLTIVSGVSMLSVLIYVMTMENSGIVIDWTTGHLSITALIASIFYGVAIGFFVACLILLILRLFKIKKHLRKLNAIFSIIAAILIFIAIVMALATETGKQSVSALEKLFYAASDFFAMFFALLMTCIGYQLNFDPQPVISQ